MNAFLKQFIRDREITLSANELRPTQYLIDYIEEAEREYATGKVIKFDNAADFITALNK